MNKLSTKFANLRDKCQTACLKPLVMMSVASMSTKALAQEDTGFNVPSVTLPGVDTDSSPLDMFFAVIKYLFLFAVWLFIIFMAFTVLKTVLVAFNKVRRDEETVVGDIIGKVALSIGGLLFVIFFAGWLTLYLV